MTMRHILVATDLSAPARAAYGHAAAFARAFGGAVRLLHVDELEAEATIPPDQRGTTSREATIDAGLQSARADFEALGIAVAVERASGNAAKVILERSEADADLIVLAKHGTREQDPHLMGGTSERVSHAAALPVLVVYEGAPPPATGEPLRVPAYVKAAVTTDYSDDSHLGIAEALALTRPFGTRVTAVHALAVSPGTLGETRESYVEAQREHLAKRCAEQFDDPRLDTLVASGAHVPEAVIDAALGLGAELLCVPTHGKGAIRRALFGSVADRVIKLAPLTALILPRAWLRRS